MYQTCYENKLCSISQYLLTVMRLGKKKEKEKESEPKSQVVEGVSRLICSAKTHSVPLKGNTSALEYCLQVLI
jgi:hypothetical protein